MILIALAVLAADPASLSRVIASAKSGDIVRLVAGTYPPLTIRSRTFDPPLTVDATAATMTSVKVMGSTGVRWTGGTMKGLTPFVAGANWAFFATASNAVTVDGVQFSNYMFAVMFDNVTGGAVTNNWMSHMYSDGIDIAASRSIAITHNTCSDFTPGEGTHPDCIQLWSRHEVPPVADIEISGNSAVGAMQGISLFNGPVGGFDAGGFDRVAVTGNTVTITYGDGISLMDCRGCSVKNNKISSLPNYLYRAQLNLTRGSVVNCGNEVTMVPRQSTPTCAQ